MRYALLAAVLLASTPGARAQSKATLRGLDVYRSAALTADEARRRFDERLRRVVTLRNEIRPAALQEAEALRREMEREAAGLPGVAFAELILTEHYTSVDRAFYAVFDIVDRADASRLAFAPAPKEVLKDPGGVLAAWRSYVDRGEALSRRGEMPPERPACPGFYCLWGGTPELDAAQGAFVAAAAGRSEELKRVVRADADAEARSAALFVLSYSTSGAEVVGLCREALTDPDARVRGAALQILADASVHPELPIALDRVLPRLDDPSAAVRGKTMGLLVPLAGREAYRRVMLPAAPRLAALLRLSQPESRDLAFTLLGILSKKNYDRQDFSAWDAWAAKAAAGKP